MMRVPFWSALEEQQKTAAVTLFLSTVVMITWRYFGSAEFYREHLADRLALGLDPRAAAAWYRFVTGFALLGLMPALIGGHLLGRGLASYGVRLGILVRTVRSAALLAPIFIFLGWISSHDPSMARCFPTNPAAGSSLAMFALHAAIYLLHYAGWEFHFRGFLQMGLRDSLGDGNALLVQVMASTLVHIGSPAIETYGAIAGGILWGILAYRTQSLLSGMVQHACLGIALDAFLCFR